MKERHFQIFIISIVVLLATIFAYNYNNYSHKLDINNATVSELQKIYGIGEVKAMQIIEYRSKNRIEHIEELQEIEGIGEGTINILKNKTKVRK